MRSIQLFASFAVLTSVILTRVCDANTTINGCRCLGTAIMCSDPKVTLFGPEDRCNKILTHILLDGNQIRQLRDNAFSGLTQLKWLVMHNNKLRALSEEIFKESRNLEFLVIEKNLFRNFPKGLFSELQKLTHIDLSKNQLENIPAQLFSGLRSLELLSLSRNKLTSLPQLVFSDLKNLRYLDLSSNQLKSLPSGIFKNLISLKTLYLTSNQLTSIKGSDLNGMVSLDEFGIEDNRLSVLPPYDESWPAISTSFYFVENNITSVKEDVLRSWLDSGEKRRVLTLSTKDTTPLGDVSSLSSVLRDRTVEPIISRSCNCGGIKKGNAEVRFCVDISCGGSNQPKNWLAAIRK